MRILITGGAGFIGSHLSERLLACGHELAIIDDLNDFYAVSEKETNLQHIRSNGTFVFFRTSVHSLRSIIEAFNSFRPSAVIHLAARAGIQPSITSPLLYERVNVRGTLNILEAVVKYKVTKLVFASSSSVYGNNVMPPFREDATINSPLSPYAATKICGEHLCYVYSKLHGFQALCLRFFTVYGPRQRPDLAIRKFMERIDGGKAVTIFGDGTSARDYTYVSDIVDGIVSSLECNSSFDVFNLGNASPVSITGLVAGIETVLGKRARILTSPDLPGDMKVTCANISKASNLLNYSPKVSFMRGLELQAEWLQSKKQIQA